MAFVRTDVSGQPNASIVRVIRLDDLGTMLAVTSIRMTLIRRFLQEPHGLTSQKTAFFKVAAVKTTKLVVVRCKLIIAKICRLVTMVY
jgi:hypothetical protein